MLVWREIIASPGNSSPFLRRPQTSRHCPMRRFPSPSPCGKAAHLTHVLLAVALREQHFHLLSDRLARAVAEGPLRSPVERHDAAFFIRADNRISDERQNFEAGRCPPGRRRCQKRCVLHYPPPPKRVFLASQIGLSTAHVVAVHLLADQPTGDRSEHGAERFGTARRDGVAKRSAGKPADEIRQPISDNDVASHTHPYEYNRRRPSAALCCGPINSLYECRSTNPVHQKPAAAI